MRSETGPGEALAAWPVAAQTTGPIQTPAGTALAWSDAAHSGGRAADRLAAARAGARAVARVSGCAERAVALLHRSSAAPVALRRRNGAVELLPCRLSIAHSGGRAVAAAASGAGRIGVDLERGGAVACHQLRLFASPQECALGIEPTTLWTLKEAAWKAFSCDATTPFHALTIAAVDATLSATRVVFALRGDIRPGFVQVWHPWPGWIAALVEVA
jgi:4'-phosphopantetheinyl transferase EntD